MGHTVCVATIQLCHCREKETIDCPETNECVCEPIKLCWWTFKCEFYIIFMSWNFFLLIFSQLYENVKAILSSQALQKQVVGQPWPTGSSLPYSSLRYGALYAKSGYSMRRIPKKPALVVRERVTELKEDLFFSVVFESLAMCLCYHCKN